MSTIYKRQECPVEAVSWDLTWGVAGNCLGKLVLRSTSSSSASAPEAIDHVGIIVYNRLYEFGNRGVLKSSIPRDSDPIPEYPAFKLRKRESLGSTTKTRQEFIEWLVEAKYGKFKRTQYDMVNHNCVDFAKSVCEFLNVAYPTNWDKICNWAKENEKFVDMFVKQAEKYQRRSSTSEIVSPRRLSLSKSIRSMSLEEDKKETG